MVLDADVVEYASGPPHGVDGDGGHDRSPNKKHDATDLVGVVLQRIRVNTGLVWFDTTLAVSGRPSVGPVVPLTAVDVGQMSPSAGARAQRQLPAGSGASLVGIVNL